MMRIDKGELLGSVRTYMLCIHSRTTLKDESLGYFVVVFFFFLLYYYSSLALSIRTHGVVCAAVMSSAGGTAAFNDDTSDPTSAGRTLCWSVSGELRVPAACYHYKNTSKDTGRESASFGVGWEVLSVGSFSLSGTRRSSPVFCELQLFFFLF